MAAIGQLHWIDRDGLVTELREMWGRDGSSGAPGVPLMYRAGTEAGARARDPDRVDPAQLVIPVLVGGQTAGHAAYEADRRALLRTLKRGPGKLRRTDASGTQRTLRAIYLRGLGAVEEYVDHHAAVLEFVSDGEPFWSDATVQSRTYDTGAPTGLWLPQGTLPIVSSTAILGTETVTVDGDVHSWPSWAVTGPLDDLILEHLGAGEMLDLTGYSIAAGEVVTITTAPGSKLATSSSTGDLWSSLSNDSAFWPLLSGANSFRMQGVNADGNTEIVLQWQNRYEGD